jgi:CheY-like chemotaxis protein
MLTGKRIIIVDDDSHNLTIFETVLQHANAETTCCSRAEDALDHLRRTPDAFDIALIDLALPEMDGWGLLEAIRINPKTAELVCFAVTAYDDDAVRREVIQAGFNGYFPKPIHPQTFAAEIEAVL